MEARVPSATQALLKMGWGLLLVQAVAMVRWFNLASSVAVYVTKGIQDKTETTAQCVTPALIKKNWDLLLAEIVHHTMSRRLVASHEHNVFAQKAFICQKTGQVA